jgi:hypothetical protein
MRVRGRPLASWALIAVLAQLSVRGIAGGTALVAAPSGRLVGLTVDGLARTPFPDYRLPGLVLLVAFGLAPAAACYALSARLPRAPAAAAAVGAALLCWLLVEALAGFERPTMWPNLATAVAVVALASRPSVGAADRGRPR